MRSSERGLKETYMDSAAYCLKSIVRFLYRFGLAGLLCVTATVATAQTLDDIFKPAQRDFAAGSLAILGTVGIPDDSASAISSRR